MMHYISDNADKVDVNAELRRLIDKTNKSTSKIKRRSIRW